MNFGTFLLTLISALGVLYYMTNFYDWESRAKRDVAQICKDRGFKEALLYETTKGKYVFECTKPVEIKDPGRGLP